VDSKPEELDELDRRVIQLKIEREALRKETDSASRDRLGRLEKELAELEEKANAMTAAWQASNLQVTGMYLDSPATVPGQAPDTLPVNGHNRSGGIGGRAQIKVARGCIKHGTPARVPRRRAARIHRPAPQGAGSVAD